MRELSIQRYNDREVGLCHLSGLDVNHRNEKFYLGCTPACVEFVEGLIISLILWNIFLL